MSTPHPEDYQETPLRYVITLNRMASETITVEGDEASTIDAAQEIAYQRAEGSLCHKCAEHLTLSDNDQDHVVEVYADEDSGPGQTHEIVHDYAAEDLEARLTATRNATLAEVADALAAISTGEMNEHTRNKLRECAVKLRGAKMMPGKVNLA